MRPCIIAETPRLKPFDHPAIIGASCPLDSTTIAAYFRRAERALEDDDYIAVIKPDVPHHDGRRKAREIIVLAGIDKRRLEREDRIAVVRRELQGLLKDLENLVTDVAKWPRPLNASSLRRPEPDQWLSGLTAKVPIPPYSEGHSHNWRVILPTGAALVLIAGALINWWVLPSIRGLRTDTARVDAGPTKEWLYEDIGTVQLPRQRSCEGKTEARKEGSRPKDVLRMEMPNRSIEQKELQSLYPSGRELDSLGIINLRKTVYGYKSTRDDPDYDNTLGSLVPKDGLGPDLTKVVEFRKALYSVGDALSDMRHEVRTNKDVLEKAKDTAHKNRKKETEYQFLNMAMELTKLQQSDADKKIDCFKSGKEQPNAAPDPDAVLCFEPEAPFLTHRDWQAAYMFRSFLVTERAKSVLVERTVANPTLRELFARLAGKEDKLAGERQALPDFFRTDLKDKETEEKLRRLYDTFNDFLIEVKNLNTKIKELERQYQQRSSSQPQEGAKGKTNHPPK